MSQVTVEIGFRSGNILKIKCESFQFTGRIGSGDWSYSIKGLPPGTLISLDLSQAEYIRTTQ